MVQFKRKNKWAILGFTSHGMSLTQHFGPFWGPSSQVQFTNDENVAPEIALTGPSPVTVTFV